MSRLKGPRKSSPQTRFALLSAASTPRPAYPRHNTLTNAVELCDAKELVDLAISQGVASLVSSSLAPSLKEKQRARLLKRAAHEAAKLSSYTGLLAEVAPILDQADIVWAAVKGPVLVTACYANGARWCGDLDIVVAADQFAQAVGALREAGLVLAVERWAPFVASRKGEVPMLGANGLRLDLHWHLVSESRTRQRYTIDCKEVLDRRRTMQVAEAAVWALEPTDFAVHVALHAAFSGTHKLRLLVDIERTVTNQPPDWELFVQRCRDWRVALPVAVALQRARQALAAPVPAEVVDALVRTRGERFLVDLLADWSPGGKLPGERSLRNGLARSVRDNLWSTATSFAAELYETATSLLPGTLAPQRKVLARQAFAVDDGAGFESYLKMVANSDRYGHAL